MKFGWGKLIPVLLFFLFFCVYIYSACRTNSGYADSDEIVTAGYLLSVAHPPGYPLQTVLTKLFTLIPVGSIAFRANIMSGFFGALTVAMVYVVGKKVIGFRLQVVDKISQKSKVKSQNHNLKVKTLKEKENSKEGEKEQVISNNLQATREEKKGGENWEFLKELVCVMGAMVLGFSSQFWLYSSVAEVFALNNFLVILGIWLGVKWREEKLRIENCELRIKKKEKRGEEEIDSRSRFSFYSIWSRMTHKKELLYFVLCCIVIGIGLSHVQTYVLMLPGFILLFFTAVKKRRELRIKNYELRGKKSPFSGLRLDKPLYKKEGENNFVLKRIFLGTVLVFGSFVLVNFLLFWLNSQEQNFSWYFPQNLKGLYQEVTRWVYTDYNLENGETASAYFGKFDLGKYIKTIPMYFGFLNEHFGYIGLGLGILGIVGWWKNTPRLSACSSQEETLKLLFWSFGVWFLCGGLLMGILSGFQERRPSYLFYNSNVGMLQRQYLQGEVVWGVFIMMGIWMVVKWFVYKKSKKNTMFCNLLFFRETHPDQAKACLPLSRGDLIIGIVFCSVMVGWMGLSNYNIGVQRNTTIAHDYAKTVLDSVEKDSVIICLYDFPCFSLIYLQEVEGYRRDVTVLPRNRFFKYYFFERNPQYYAYNYLDHKDYASALVYWNLQNRKTYLTNLMPDDFNFGMYDGTFFIIPHGYLFEVRKDIPDEIYEGDYKLTENFLAAKKDKRNYSLNGIEDLLSSIHHVQAQQYAFLGDQKKAMENIFLAQKLNKDFVQNKNLISRIAILPKNSLYEKGNITFGAHEFIEHAKEKEKSGEKKLALANYQRATFVEPRNKEARVMLAQFYLKNGMIREGFEELRRLNLMNPQDKEIEKALEELRIKLGIK